MTLLIIIGIILFHTAMVARLQPVFAKISAAHCGNCLSHDGPYRVGRNNYEPGTGHDSNGLGYALFWPVTAPYVLINSKYNRDVQRGIKHIDRYWETKAIEESAAHIRNMERLNQINQ